MEDIQRDNLITAERRALIKSSMRNMGYQILTKEWKMKNCFFLLVILNKHSQQCRILGIHLNKTVPPVNNGAAGGRMHAAYSEFVEVSDVKWWAEAL